MRKHLQTYWWIPGVFFGCLIGGCADDLAGWGVSTEAALWIGFLLGTLYGMFWGVVRGDT